MRNLPLFLIMAVRFVACEKASADAGDPFSIV